MALHSSTNDNWMQWKTVKCVGLIFSCCSRNSHGKVDNEEEQECNNKVFNVNNAKLLVLMRKYNNWFQNRSERYRNVTNHERSAKAVHGKAVN